MHQITALMTTYNSAPYLKDTMDSILNQTYPDFEFLIIDDGSTDDTVAIIKSYKDQRIRLIENKTNRGVGFRLSESLNFINTPYIAKVDSDDISLPERFAKQLQYLEQHNDISLVKCYIEYFPDDKDVSDSERFSFIKNVKQSEINAIDSPTVISHQLKRWLCIPHTTYFGKTSSIKMAGYPDTRSYEDYSLFYHILEQGEKIGCVPETLVKMRISNISTTATIKQSSLDQGLETIIGIKKKIIEPILKKENIYIFGCGQLAFSLTRVLQRQGIEIQGYIDRNPTIAAKKTELPILTLNDYLKINKSKSIIVAAQPVRTEICNQLIESGLSEWSDFMVIA